MRNPLVLALALGISTAATTGCAGGLAAPFDQMKAQPVTVYRLQNFEPPAPAMGANGLPLPIPVPQEIQKWVGGVGSMLPPNLIPPGILPGGTPAPSQDVARFHAFRILGWMQVTDSAQKDEILEVFGKEKNWDATRSSCMYAEFGVAVSQMNQPPADVLISLSCSQVRPFGFVWPYGTKTGMKPETVKKVSEIMSRVFPG